MPRRPALLATVLAACTWNPYGDPVEGDPEQSSSSSSSSGPSAPTSGGLGGTASTGPDATTGSVQASTSAGASTGGDSTSGSTSSSPGDSTGMATTEASTTSSSSGSTGGGTTGESTESTGLEGDGPTYLPCMLNVDCEHFCQPYMNGMAFCSKLCTVDEECQPKPPWSDVVPVCHLEKCALPCEVDADCHSGMACFVSVCGWLPGQMP